MSYTSEGEAVLGRAPSTTEYTELGAWCIDLYIPLGPLHSTNLHLKECLTEEMGPIHSCFVGAWTTMI